MIITKKSESRVEIASARASKKGGCTVLDLPVNTVVNPIESPDRKDSFAART
jgi:hypothetical protein